MRIRTHLLAPLAVLAAACASTPPSVEPLRVGATRPAANEKLAVDHALLLVDASGSLGEAALFPTEKALLESFVAAIPDGSFTSAMIGFGGFQRETTRQARFERSGLQNAARSLRYLSEATPLDRVLSEDAREILAGTRGRAAVVLFSDGRPTDYAGRAADERVVLEAARSLAKARAGETCFHTVRVGSDPAGEEFLRRLSKVTSCGSHRVSDTTFDPQSIDRFARAVFFDARPLPRVAAPPPDGDGDGVVDAKDECRGTPRGARVDSRGCWVIRGLEFAVDSAEIEPGFRQELDEVVSVLRSNEGVRIRIGGHTDSTGPAAYNQRLSERRAQAVQRYLVAAGLPAGRFEVQGFGEAQPIDTNDTAAGRRRNRRTELAEAR